MRPRSRVSAREETVVAAEAGYAYASTLADQIDSQSRPGTSIYSDVDVVVTENAEHYFSVFNQVSPPFVDGILRKRKSVPRSDLRTRVYSRMSLRRYRRTT